MAQGKNAPGTRLVAEPKDCLGCSSPIVGNGLADDEAEIVDCPGVARPRRRAEVRKRLPHRRCNLPRSTLRSSQARSGCFREVTGKRIEPAHGHELSPVVDIAVFDEPGDTQAGHIPSTATSRPDDQLAGPGSTAGVSRGTEYIPENLAAVVNAVRSAAGKAGKGPEIFQASALRPEEGVRRTDLGAAGTNNLPPVVDRHSLAPGAPDHPHLDQLVSHVEQLYADTLPAAQARHSYVVLPGIGIGGDGEVGDQLRRRDVGGGVGSDLGRRHTLASQPRYGSRIEPGAVDRDVERDPALRAARHHAADRWAPRAVVLGCGGLDSWSSRLAGLATGNRERRQNEQRDDHGSGESVARLHKDLRQTHAVLIRL